jgi:UDP-glucose 4-epimerase
MLGWKPQHSGLQTILHDAWNWHSADSVEASRTASCPT